MTLRLNGSSSGSVSIDAPANTTGGADRTLTLPDDSGNGTIITTSYPSPRTVLEQFQGICAYHGSASNLVPQVMTAEGIRNFATVTAFQNLTTSYADVTGSEFTYQPPAGTNFVVYEFVFQITRQSNDGTQYSHWRFYIDDVEVPFARGNYSAEDMGGQQRFMWTIGIGNQGIGSTNRANSNIGAVSSWTSAKTMKLRARHFTEHHVRLHSTDLWDGVDLSDANQASSSSTSTFHPPQIKITALG